MATLRELLQNTPLGQQIATLKVWDIHGRLVYSTDPAEIGAVFPGPYSVDYRDPWTENAAYRGESL